MFPTTSSARVRLGFLFEMAVTILTSWVVPVMMAAPLATSMIRL
jgi:hypothetical protein